MFPRGHVCKSSRVMGGGRTGHVEKGGRLCLCLCLCVSVCARVCVCVCVYVFELRWLLVIADRRVLVS